MRLATLAIATALLMAGAPALADDDGHDQPDPAPLGDERYDNYGDILDIEEELYAQPGWWAGDGLQVSDGSGGEADLETETDAEPAWLWIADASSTDVDLEVTSHGPVAGGVDVWKWRMSQDGGAFTPDCPQDPAAELAPEEGEPAPGYLDRVLRETVDHHQRGGAYQLAGDGHAMASMSTTLFMDEAPDGYLVAIYPQASSGADPAEDAAGDAHLWWEVSGDDVRVVDALSKNTDTPAKFDEWTGFTIAENLDCPLKALDQILDNAPEVPTGPASAASAGDLLNASLP